MRPDLPARITPLPKIPSDWNATIRWDANRARHGAAFSGDAARLGLLDG
jgi:hypothetical protein